MARIIDLNTRRAVRASKAYNNLSGVPFLHAGNTVLLRDTMVMEEIEELVDTTGSTDMACGLSEEVLLDFLDEELDQVSHSRVARHLAECTCCSALLEEFKNVKEISKKICSTPVPSDSIKSRLRDRLKSELGLKSDLF
jgi:hypothetical protein